MEFLKNRPKTSRDVYALYAFGSQEEHGLAAVLHRIPLRLVLVCQSEVCSLAHPLSRDKL